jgi:hypothetical protein
MPPEEETDLLLHPSGEGEESDDEEDEESTV